MVDITHAQVIRTVRDMTRNMRGQTRGMIRRATLGTLDTTTLLQSVQVGTLKGDEDDAVELFEPYGFTSGPIAGSEGIVLRVGGERAGSIALQFGNRTFRIAGIAEGEVAMYDDQGASIVLRRSGHIEVTPGPGGVVQLGGAAAVLAVARETDPVGPSTAMSTWAGLVEGACNVAAPGTFTPANNFAALVASMFATITTGGAGSTST